MKKVHLLKKGAMVICLFFVQFAIVPLLALGQDSDWETIYSIPGRGELQVRVYINDPEAKKSYWTTNIYVRSTFFETVQYALKGDVRDKNGQERENVTLCFGVRRGGDETHDDEGKLCDWTYFNKIHVDKLVIGGKTVIEDGRKVSTNTPGLKW